MLTLDLIDEERLDGFLNYQDDEIDVVADIRGGKLYYGDDEITFKQFLEIIKSDED